jgi:hypothetical protein
MRTLFFLAAIPLLLAHLAMANNDTFAVGTCKPNLTSFTTIQTAVNSVPPGSTVLVCPGVYPEQVTIQQPLTLQGITFSNSDLVSITVPGGGLPTTVASSFGVSVAPQVIVQASGTVDITNITVDGTGGDQACSTSSTWLAGIFYGVGSYGEVDRVKASNQIDESCGVGIWAEVGSSTNEPMTIQGSSVHDVDAVGIFIASAASPAPSVTVRGNFVSPNSVLSIGIYANGVSGNLADNDVSNAFAGFFDLAPSVQIVSNIVTSTQTGVFLLNPGMVQSNRITSATAAIEFNCILSTVSNNTINDVFVGLSDVPSSFSGNNRFANATTLSTGGCPAFARAALSAVQGASSLAGQSTSPNSFFQRRTPANPLGLP